MLIPIIVLVFLQTSAGAEELAIDQSQQSASRLKNTVDAIGAQGPPAKATISIIVPQKIANITVGSRDDPYIGREIIFNVFARGGQTEIVAVALYNMTGDLSNYTKSGTYPVSIEAVDDCRGTGNPCVWVSPA